MIQEKLDGIKSRYAEMTAGSSKALRTLEQALQLATRFASAHDNINQWLDAVETELNNIEPDTTPAYQDRQKVSAYIPVSWFSLIHVTEKSIFAKSISREVSPFTFCVICVSGVEVRVC